MTIPIGAVTANFANATFAYSGIGLNVRDNGSANSSKILHITANGNPRLTVFKDGGLRVSANTNLILPSIFDVDNKINVRRLVLEEKRDISSEINTHDKAFAEDYEHIRTTNGTVVINLANATTFRVESTTNTITNIQFVKPTDTHTLKDRVYSCLVMFSGINTIPTNVWSNAGVVWMDCAEVSSNVSNSFMTYFYSAESLSKPEFNSIWYASGSGGFLVSSTEGGSTGGWTDICGPYWILDIDTPTNVWSRFENLSDVYNNPLIESAPTIFTYGIKPVGTTGNDQINCIGMRLDNTGNVTWEKTLSDTNYLPDNSLYFGSGQLDSSNNFYAFTSGSYNETGYTSNPVYINYLTKFDYSGSPVWQKGIAKKSGYNGTDFNAEYSYFGVTANNTHSVAYGKFSDTFPGTYNYEGIFFQKFDSDGNILLRKGFTSTRATLAYNGVINSYDKLVPSKCVMDNNGNIYCMAWIETDPAWYVDVGSPYAGSLPSQNAKAHILTKMNSSLEPQWSYILVPNSASSNMYAEHVNTGTATPPNIAVDYTGENIYITGKYSSSASRLNPFTFLVKLNSDGAVQWTRSINEGPFTPGFTTDNLAEGFNDIFVSLDDKIYVNYNNTVRFLANNNYATETIIMSFESNSDERWQNRLTYTGYSAGLRISKLSQNLFCNDLYVFADKSNQIYGGNGSGGTGGVGKIIMKVKSDGSLTNSYSIGANTLIYENYGLKETFKNARNWTLNAYTLVPFDDINTTNYPTIRTGAATQTSVTYSKTKVAAE